MKNDNNKQHPSSRKHAQAQNSSSGQARVCLILRRGSPRSNTLVSHSRGLRSRLPTTYTWGRRRGHRGSRSQRAKKNNTKQKSKANTRAVHQCAECTATESKRDLDCVSPSWSRFRRRLLDGKCDCHVTADGHLNECGIIISSSSVFSRFRSRGRRSRRWLLKRRCLPGYFVIENQQDTMHLEKHI